VKPHPLFPRLPNPILLVTDIDQAAADQLRELCLQAEGINTALRAIENNPPQSEDAIRKATLSHSEPRQSYGTPRDSGTVAQYSESKRMKPYTHEWYKAALRSVEAARLAEPMRNELRKDTKEKGAILLELLREEE